jgi:pyruvate formate lyase activating enzyme
VAWTYNEPTIWIEYVLDGARVAHENGMYTVMVTNGYITEEALDVLAPHIDAYRVDVKGFSNELYRVLCRIKDFHPVLAAAVRAKHEHDCHVEIVTNVIPTLNDDDTTLRAIAGWVAAALGPKTPWHVTRFMPYLDLSHLPPTPVRTLERAKAICDAEGLEYVYIGNIPGHQAENTKCPKCKRVVVERAGFIVRSINLDRGKCHFCKHAIPGVWEGGRTA